jgi:hypothetical protein
MRSLCLLLVTRNRPGFVLASLLLVSFLATAQAQTSPARKPQPSQKTVDHASWAPGLEGIVGIAEEDFRDMGLAALTKDQELYLLVWASGLEQKGKDSVQVPSFECGRPGQKFQDAKPEEYDKVRVNVEASGSADEVVSGVRERLRMMNGTEVVYNSDEADLTVFLTGMKIHTKGGIETGVAVAVTVVQPCTWTLGTYTNHYNILKADSVEVGSEPPLLVSSIVSGIDTDVLDNQRKMNAGYRKFLQDQKKK